MPGLSVQILDAGRGDHHGHREAVVLTKVRVAEGGAEDRGQGVVLALGVAASIPPAASGGASPSVSGFGLWGCTCRVRRTWPAVRRSSPVVRVSRLACRCSCRRDAHHGSR